MKTKLLISYLILLNIFVCQAQIDNNISCDNRTSIDTVLVKKEIVRLSNPQREEDNGTDKLPEVSDIDDMLVVDIMDMNIDTLTNEISFEVDTTKHLLFFYKQNYTYELTGNMVPLVSKTNDKLTFRLGQLAQRDIECIYYIPTLFSMDEKSDWDNIFYFKVKGSSQEYYFDTYGYLFTSLDDLLEYRFGSTENYITTYRKRMINKSQRFEEFRKFLENVPITNNKIRIRGN